MKTVALPGSEKQPCKSYSSLLSPGIGLFSGELGKAVKGKAPSIMGQLLTSSNHTQANKTNQTTPPKTINNKTNKQNSLQSCGGREKCPPIANLPQLPEEHFLPRNEVG